MSTGHPADGPADTAWGGGPRTWRCGHQGKDLLYYEEWGDGQWRRLVIDGELLAARDPHHLVFLPSETDWQRLPDWARGRRAEILQRVRQGLGPGYEFHPPDP